MFIQDSGDFQLRTYAVYGGNKYRMIVSFKFKKTAEEPDSAEDFRAIGRTGDFAYEFFNPG